MRNILIKNSLALGLLAIGSTTALAQGAPRGGHTPPSFAQLDSNHDGVLTLEEVQAIGHDKFSAADTNGDGFLDVAELTAAAQRARAGLITRMIAHKDTNGDGMLSPEEMAAPGKHGGRHGKNKGQRLFAHADADSNGEITQAEWDAAIAKRHGS